MKDDNGADRCHLDGEMIVTPPDAPPPAGGASAPAGGDALARPGETCWRRARADRVGVLVDGAAYFRALRHAIIAARRSIFILAWELHSEVDLLPGEDPGDGWPTRLGPLLRAVVRRRPRLQVRILLWDFVVIYALERELVPSFRLPWKAHRRIRMVNDDAHPPGGSQHQKLVVVDDCLAFCGGIDVTGGRWDTPEHRIGDPRRRTPAGKPYAPFHDVQLMVDGEAAAAIGELARERWRRAGGRAIPPVADLPAIWPDVVAPAFRDVAVAIARTEPAYDGRPAVREVEALYLASIAAARRHIYIENQYFTSAAVAAAIERSLHAPAGPEIVMLVPSRNEGWLEDSTMGVGRSRLLRRLRQADRHGRLAVYTCALPLTDGQCLNLHAKVMVVDDRLMRVGSSNLSNRSMGLDSECDLAIEAGGDAAVAASIARFRDGLLAEHLGCDPPAVAAAIAGHGSLIRAIDALARGPRRLEPFVDPVPALLDRLAPDTDVIDPDHPIAPEELAARLLAPEEFEVSDTPAEGGRRLAWRRLLRPGLLLLALVVLAAAWALTPLREVARIEVVLDWAAGWRDSPLAPLYVVLAFVVGGFVAFPVTVLISLTGALFPPLWGFLYAIVGVLCSAALLFFLGFLLGRDAVRRFGSRTVTRLSERLGERGIASVAIIRLVPIAPFSLVNLVAGATHIRFRDFIAGTVLGMAPGALALILLGDRLAALMRDPTPAGIAGLAGAGVVLAAVAYGADRWVARRRRRGA